MAFTRFHDDPCRVQENFNKSEAILNYQINVPGNSYNYFDDPFIRLEKYGANWQPNKMDIENNLKNIDRPLSRDYNIHVMPEIVNEMIPTHNAQTEQSSFISKEKTVEVGYDRWCSYPFINPQANIEIPFRNEISTRFIQKENLYT